MAEQAAKAPVAGAGQAKATAFDVMTWIAGIRLETVETLQDARAALEMDARVSARSRATVRRIDALIERIGGR